MNILEGWDISNFEDGILRHVSRSNPFLYDIQTLNPGRRGSSHFSPLDAVLDPVYRPGIAPDTLKDFSCSSPLAPDTLVGSPRSSPLAPALNTTPGPDANLLYFLRQFQELIQLFPIPNQTVVRAAVFVFNNNRNKS